MVTIEEVLKKVTDSWDKFVDWISTGLGAVWAWIIYSVDEARMFFEGLYESLRGLGELAYNTAEDAMNKARQAIIDAADAFSNAVADAQAYADELFANIDLTLPFTWGDITTAVSNAYTDAVNYVDSAVSGFQTTMDELRVDLDFVAGTLADMLVELELFVSQAIDNLLNFLVETEEESKKYKEEAAK